MKKTNQISTVIVAIAAVTMFVACKKEIDTTKTPASTTINFQDVTKKPPIGYTGGTGTSDSTTQKGL
jgi:hypothetical protein